MEFISKEVAQRSWLDKFRALGNRALGFLQVKHAEIIDSREQLAEATRKPSGFSYDLTSDDQNESFRFDLNHRK